MRLARLDLTSYGRFTDASFAFPQGERDLHIVFGLNEAGKTTSLIAIEDLLFGIPDRSPYSFRHDYSTMRIGAVVENRTDQLEFQRRKGKKDTILGSDGLPMVGDEGLLGPFLGGADRAFYDRMFNLGHDRLAKGGKAIIEAKDDIGQMMFSAGTGLTDLRERLSRLEKEADEIWAPRRAVKRHYYQAEDRLKVATNLQRKCTLSASDWRKLKAVLDDAERAYDKCRQQHEATSIELKKLARIRRIHAFVRRRGELEQDITELGYVIELPTNANTLLDEAEKNEAEIKPQVEILTSQFEQASQKLAGLEYDRVLVQRSDDITYLHEQRIEIRREKDDLPKRRRDFDIELRELTRFAAGLGWDTVKPDDLIDRVPARAKIERLQTLENQRGTLEAAVQTARMATKEARFSLKKKKKERLSRMGEVLDVSRLTAVLNAVRHIGDVESRIRIAQNRVQEISEQIERINKILKLSVPDEQDIEVLRVPLRTTIEEHHRQFRDLAQRQPSVKQRLFESLNELERDQNAFNFRIRNEGLVALDALDKARARRDDLWKLITLRHVEGGQIPSDKARDYSSELEHLPSAFEEAIRDADSISDRRFEKAKETGALAELGRKIDEQQTVIAQMEAQANVLTEESDQLNEVWMDLWEGVPVVVQDSEDMLVWLDTYDDLVNAIRQRREICKQLDDYKTEEQGASSLVIAELVELGVDTCALQSDSLRVIIESAEAILRTQKDKVERLEEMQDSIRDAKIDVKRHRNQLKQVQLDLEDWLQKWLTAVAETDLQIEFKPEAVNAQIGVVNQMRDHSGRAKDLRDKRILTIERDIEDFYSLVTQTVIELAPDLVNISAENAVLELEHRRDEAVELHEQYKEVSENIVSLQRQLKQLEEAREKAWTLVQPLIENARVEEIDDLKVTIEQSDRLRKLRQELADVHEKLNQQGDGLAMGVLEEECRAVDIDQVRTREEEAEGELKILQENLQNAAVVKTQAHREFKEIGGDDTAAKAAADRQEALAAMREAAERYVRVKSSAVLLRWAIDRYRKEKQGPLLKRAGELFQVLTLKSFERLEVGFDERENMRLTGVRPDGEVVAVPGLSNGTEDQLFLALRISAVEDYLGNALALPFVADDLFINFDPDRSAAGFEVLGQLAERTQVLFYTHHPHLVEIAQKTLGTDINVISLTELV